jgi:GntR family transcriptional repressor for pyruvate dehydrogenase complex
MEAGFEPIGPRRAFEGAVEQIAQRIRHGDLGEGDRLPSERVLAEAMRISRPTLREAVKVLAKAGVLEVHPGATGGIFVASGYVPIELLRLQSDVRLAEVAGVLEARRLLEPQVAHFAAQNASAADFERMQLTIEAHKQMLRSGEVLEREDRFLQLDMQFHVRMAEATGNPTVVGLMRSLLRRLEIGRDLALRQPPIPEWVVDIHERTLAALRSNDHGEIAAVMNEHLGGMERAWEQETGRRLRLLT